MRIWEKGLESLAMSQMPREASKAIPEGRTKCGAPVELWVKFIAAGR
jgi:hypothetical protein